MGSRLRALVQALDRTWGTAQVSSKALGKYIILYASVLHIGWAVLLLVSWKAANSTPVRIISQVFGGRWRAAVVLAAVAIAAMAFPLRSNGRRRVWLLIPQQVVLLLSAGAGVHAAAVQHYADGVARSWPFILSDQLPVVLAALLYTACIFEAAVTHEVPQQP
jgi:hypothetical protein